MTFQQSDQEGVRIAIHDLEHAAVDAVEHVHHRERDPLVAVDERVILDQALEQRGGLLDDVAVVAGPGTEQRGLERTEVTDPGRTTELLDEDLVEGEDLA
jgi:hypothetical protein